MENIIEASSTPMGMRESGEAIYLSSEDRSGIMQIFGRSGQGKSVEIESIIISDMYNGRGGMVIEPYGDMIKDIKEYIPADKKDKVIFFESCASSVEENIKKFQAEIDFSELEKDKQKMLFCKIDYRTLGTDGAREFGGYVTKQFLQTVDSENRTLVIDEAHNLVDEEILEYITKSQEKGLSCILLDQLSMDYRTDIIEALLKTANHICCYFVAPETANLINKHHPEMIANEILALEKFTFIAKFNAKTETPSIMKLKQIFPLPFPKNE